MRGAVAALAAAVLLGSAGGARAAGFMLLPGIPGDATEATHVGWNELLQVAFGHTQALDPAELPGGTIQAGFRTLRVLKAQDSGTQELKQAALTGTTFATGVIELTREPPGLCTDPRLKLDLTGVGVEDVIETASSGASPTELVRLRFASVTLTYIGVDAVGQCAPPVVLGPIGP